MSDDRKNGNRLQILRTFEPASTDAEGAAAQEIGEAESATCVTFVMHNEDHTLGNALRHVIMKNPDVQFCGYTVPHPLENKIHFRIQTYGIPAQEALRKGLVDLKKLCEHVLITFQVATTEAKSAKSNS